MTRIAGIAAFGRSSACLLENGALRQVAVEEWFSRRKDDPALPEKSFRWCCEASGVPIDEVEYVVFAEKPVQKFIRILARLAQGFPRTLRDFPDSMFTWLGDRLWLKSALVRGLGVDPDRLLFVERSVAQIAAAYLPSPFDDAAVLIVDGSGEWATTSLAKASTTPEGRSTLETLAEIQHPHSLMFVLEAVARHLLVPSQGGVRWLAALAAYGQPRFADELARAVPEEPDGAFSLDPRSFLVSRGTARFRSSLYASIGDPRGDGQPLRFGDAAGPEAARFADLARSAQEVCADRCVALAREAARRTGSTRLCLGGPVFLDPVVLERTLSEAPFEQVFVAPYLDDAAPAIGAALYVSHVAQGTPRPESLEQPVVAPVGVPPATAQYEVATAADDDLVRAAVEALSRGRIVAWVDGAPDLEPRPRGRCVLLADPADRGAVERLRAQVKLAEPFVPLGTIALEGVLPSHPTAACREATRAGRVRTPVGGELAGHLSGVVHVDGTVLAHQVDASLQPRLCAVLRGFASATGRPAALAQTSFNRACDPPVFGAAEAGDLVRRSDIDLLVWGRQLVSKVVAEV